MAGKRRISSADLFEIKIVNDPVISPDGQTVAYTVTQMDREENRYRAAIWLVDLASGRNRQLTSGGYRDGQPAWAPDGQSLAFVSDRDTDGGTKGQVWRISASGGEATRLSSFQSSVEQFAWSPDGRQIACVLKVRETEARPDSDVRVITTIRYRFDGEGYLDDSYRQIFLLDVLNGETKQVTSGPYEHSQPAWSPTGHEIAFAANRDAGWELARHRDVHVVKPASGVIRKVSDGSGAWGAPSWSPDGTLIAMTGTRNLTSDAPRTEVFVVPAGGGSPESITSSFDRSVGDGCIADLVSYPTRKPAWISNDELAIVYSDRGSVRVATVAVGDERVTPVTAEGRRVGCINVLPDGGFVYAGNDQQAPGELFTCSADGTRERQLTSVNDSWLEGVELAHVEPFDVRAADGSSVHGWVMKPVGFIDGNRYPSLLQIHGGPFGMYGETFMHEFQMLAAEGYVVVFTNPRGSTGYGDDWAQALHLNWGINDMQDQMAAVDHAIEQGWADPARIGVLGGSYGGFITNWMISHTDRFKAAITMRTLSNLYSAYGTDDIMFNGTESHFGADPWVDDTVYWKLSPISYVDQIETPLLIMHSEEDFRCPMGQAEELFTALKVRGQKVELVRFPNESHGLSRTGQPKHRIERLKFISDWFGEHL